MKGAIKVVVKVIVEVEVELVDMVEYKVDIVTMMMKMTSKHNKEEEVLLEGMIKGSLLQLQQI